MRRYRKAINIMFVTPCFGVGGLEQVVLNILQFLDRDKFNPLLCTLLEPDECMYEEAKRLDLPCHTVKKKPGIDYLLPFKLREIFNKEKIDLINSHDIGATLYAAPAARLCGIKRIVHTDHSQILTKRKHLKMYRWLMGSLVSSSITVSEALERHLVNELGISAKKVKTIPNGIDVKKYAVNGDIEYLKKAFGLGEDESVVGSIGRLTAQKGYEYLLKAFKMVLGDKPETRLIIVGDGDERSSLEEIAKDLGIRKKVIFTGIRRDIPNLLWLFDVFVLSSLWEGQPITIIEAMAAGKAIVVTDVGDNAEILGQGKRGLIVPSKDPVSLANSITLLLNDRQLAGRLGAEAREHSMENLSHIGMVRKYEQVFLRIMSNQG